MSEYVEDNLGKNSLTDEERQDTRWAISQCKRKLIERAFGWSKLNRPLREVKLRGLDRVDWFYRPTIVAHNLVSMRRLIAIESLAIRAEAQTEERKLRRNALQKAKKSSPGQNKMGIRSFPQPVKRKPATFSRTRKPTAL